MQRESTTAGAPKASRSGAVTLTAALALLVLSVVFIAEAGSWYVAFKALHVGAAVLWVGGAALLTILALSAERADDSERLFAIGRQAEWASRIFIPASLVVLVFGIAMTVNGDLDWGAFWIVFGLAAWAVSTAIGIFYLTPKTKLLAVLVAERGEQDPETQSLLSRLLLAARLDLALLFLIVVDMTVKPFS